RFPDGQLYLDLQGYSVGAPLSAGQALDHLFGSLGVTAPDVPPHLPPRAARDRGALAGRPAPVGLGHPGPGRPGRPPRPGGASRLVVVTSRDALAGLVARDGARRVRLDTLALTDAVELLSALAPDRIAAEPEAAVELANRCGRLPLALRIAADLLTA